MEKEKCIKCKECIENLDGTHRCARGEYYDKITEESTACAMFKPSWFYSFHKPELKTKNKGV